MSAFGQKRHSVSSRFLRCSSSRRLLENNWTFLHISRAGLPDAGSHYIDDLFRAGDRSIPFATVSLMSRRRRVFVDTPKGRRSAGFSVPESPVAADVSLALRSRGLSPYALRLDPEQSAWIAFVMDWRRAA